MNRTLISVMEAIYVLYMFRIFKTKFSMNWLPLKFLDYSSYLIHQKQASNVPVSHICQFGHDMAILIALYLVFRHYNSTLSRYNTTILSIIVLGCFMNLNALIYFLPIIYVEYYYSVKIA